MGARGEGRWEQVSWNEALDEIAVRLAHIRERDGAEAVAYLSGAIHGSDQSMGIRFINLFGSPNYGGTSVICLGPKVEAKALTFGFAPAAADVRPGQTACVLLWGRHPSASRPTLWRRILEARRAGARLIVVDPVETVEARAADLWLQLRPSSDATLALGLLHVVLGEGLHDRGFVERWTVGFEDLARRVAEYPPERVAAVTWVPAEQAQAAARLFAGARPASICRGSPNGLVRNALACKQALAILAAVTGNLERPGGNLLPGPPARVRSKIDCQLYDELPPEQHAKRLGAERFRLHAEGYERISQAGRRLWPNHLQFIDASYGASAHPPSIFRAILSQRPYPVRALLLPHNNALGCYPNSALVREALRSDNLDLLVAHDLFPTPTAHYADYVLPAAHWLEKSFFYVAGLDPSVTAAPRALAPLHERHSDYEVFRDLDRRLGQGERWPATLEDIWDEHLAPAGVSFADLAASPTGQLQDQGPPARHDAPDASGAPRGFATPSGKVELASSILADLGYDPLPQHHEPLPPSEDDARFPYPLLTGATRIDATHQDHRQVASLRRRHPEPEVRLHPSLAQGDWAWVETRLGRVRLTTALHPRTVDAERWWYPERPATDPDPYGVMATNVNLLLDDDPDLCDPAYGSWPYRVARCNVRRITYER